MGSPSDAVPRIGLSTASVFPEPTEAGFELAAALGYDGVEVMVWTDPASQDLDELRRLRDRYQVAILAVHAPCLLATQRVWTVDPWTKLTRARAAAEALEAQTVVVHPPFRWQREYARDFAGGIARMTERTEVRFAVENMYPLRLAGRAVSAYLPSWDVTAGDEPHQSYTLDLSHTAVSRTGALAMLEVMGDRLAHVHMADGTGAARDEHLVPGRGTQPCAEVLAALSARRFTGHVVVEVSTRHAADRAEREADLAAALAFCRQHLAVESWRP